MRHATHTFSRRLGALLLCLALLAGLLPMSALAAETRETVGAFEVTGGTSGPGYSYSHGAATRAQVVTIRYRREGASCLS